MQPITIIDYGMANLRSVQKAFEKLGHAAVISSDPRAVNNAEKLVLPGVGAFRDAIARLRETGLDEAIINFIGSGRPFLGICLGLQLLFTRSFEDGEYAGLDVLAGDVVRFPHQADLKVPHMGWNNLHLRRQAPHLAGLPAEAAVYFVHSYYVSPRDPSVIATETDYAGAFTSAVWSGNIFAVQFHPEKSQQVGLQILHNFAALR
jgi:imidazole glycerol-phosphate synthase subunit HisH